MRLTIRVIDAISKDPVPYAEVYINGRRYITSPNGVLFLSLPAGAYRIRVRHPDYEDYNTFKVFEEGTYELVIPLMPKFRILR